jgi:hypothetical protein
MVDPLRHRLAKHSEGRVAILWRAEHAWSGELHSAVAHAVHGAFAQTENAGGGDVGYGSLQLEVLRARAGSNAKEAPRVRIKQADFFEALERRGYEQKKDQGREANPRLEAAEYPKRDMLPGEWGESDFEKSIF